MRDVRINQGSHYPGSTCTEAYLDEDSKDLRCCVTAIFDMFDLEQGADL